MNNSSGRKENFIVTTHSGSIYTFLKNKDNPYYTMQSERYGEREVHIPGSVMMEAPLKIVVTPNEKNGSLAGKTIQTSTVAKVRAFESNPERQNAAASTLQVTTPEGTAPETPSGTDGLGD